MTPAIQVTLQAFGGLIAVIGSVILYREYRAWKDREGP